MRHRLFVLGYAARRALGRLGRRPLSSALAIGAIAASLLLLGLVHLTARNVEAMTDEWGGGVHMVVYLEDQLGGARASEIAGALRDLPAVEVVRYVSPEEALAHLRAVLEDEALLEGVEVGMLPASLEVTLADGVAEVASAHPVAERLSSTPGVEEVEFPGEWVESLTALLAGVRTASLFLLFFVGCACVYIVAISVRLSLKPESRETEVLRLVGASEAFITAAAALEGALMGALGGLAALGLLGVLYSATASGVQTALEAAFGTAPISFLPAADAFLLVGLGGAFGLAGTFFSGPERSRALA